MLTLCWAAKGGSGTTVVAAGLALAHPDPTLLVDLAGDLPAALGIPQPATPGAHDWLVSSAPPERLASLEVRLTESVGLIPAGSPAAADPGRWRLLAEHLGRERRRVVVDAGTGTPPAELVGGADQAWLVTRNCYLGLLAASRAPVRADGVVVVEEPGRRFTGADVEHALSAPVVATVLQDPAIARAADSGLLLSRLPAGLRRSLGRPVQAHGERLMSLTTTDTRMVHQ